jgi:hypothetical protein
MQNGRQKNMYSTLNLQGFNRRDAHITLQVHFDMSKHEIIAEIAQCCEEMYADI